MKLSYEKLKPDAVKSAESGRIVKACVEMLAQSYNDPRGLFEEGLHTWEWFIHAKDETDSVVGFLGWNVHTVEIDGKPVFAARARIGATTSDRRGQGLSQQIFRGMFAASLGDAAQTAGVPDAKYPSVFGWGTLISPFSYLGMLKMFSPSFFPTPEGKGDDFSIKAARKLREQVLDLKGECENPFILRGFEKFSYNESEKRKHKEALERRPVPFFDQLNLSVDKGDRVLIVYGLS